MATDMGGFAQVGGQVLVDQFGRPLAQSRNVLLPPYFRRDDITFDGTNAKISTTNTPVSGTLQIVVRSGTTTRFMEQSEITYSPSSGYSLNYIPAAGDIGCVSYFSATPIIGPSTLATGVDPFFANVSSLLHFDGSTGSTTFLDQKGNTWTASGNAQISTAQKKFGSSSGLWDGASDYISTAFATAFNISTGDFTLESFVRPVLGGDRNIGSQRDSGAEGWALEVRATGAIWLRAKINGVYSDTKITTATGLVSAGNWYHIALTRNGNLFTIWLDGVSVATLTSAGTLDNNSGAPLRIGRSQSSSEDDYSGYMDEFRLTKGVCRYTSTFTPPSAPFPDS